MHIPQELKYLGGCFYSRSDQEFGTIHEWVSETVRKFLLPEQQKVVRQFLDELLSRLHSDEELERIWQKLDSDYRIDGGAGVRAFFTLIRDSIE